MKITRTYLKAKNGLLLNVGVMAALLMVTGVWYIGVHTRVQSEIVDLRDIVEITDNIHEHGLIAINNEDLDDLGLQKVRAKKLQHLQKLFPEARQYVFSEDPAETLALQDTTLKLVEKPTNIKTSYVAWLESSFTQEMNAGLTESQKEFGEVLPVFVSLASDTQETSDIYGKVDLKNIVGLVEDDFFAENGIPNVQGALGIRNVSFDDVISDLGYYEIVARVEEIPSGNIMELIDFIGQLGSIRTQVDGENGVPEIVHLSNVPNRFDVRKSFMDEGRSALSNPLVTIPSLIIEPSGDRLSDVVSSDIDPYLTLAPRSRYRDWNMVITLRFYIRGAAPEHMDIVEGQVSQILAGSVERPKASYNTYIEDNTNWPLQDRIENALLAPCSGCDEIQSIRQLRSDLDTITSVYEKLQLEYAGPDQIDATRQIQESLDILTAILNIQSKFDRLYTKLQ